MQKSHFFLPKSRQDVPFVVLGHKYLNVPFDMMGRIYFWNARAISEIAWEGVGFIHISISYSHSIKYHNI